VVRPCRRIPVPTATPVSYHPPCTRPHTGSPMLRLEGVTKSYGGTVVLHETHLELEAGRVTVLIGPSGCGKSTLLRILMGLVVPDTGSVWFGDQRVADDDQLLPLRHRMGYVIQDGGLFPHMTARRNVELMPRYLKWEPARTGQRIANLAKLVSLPGAMLDRYPIQLSGGQRQRVSLMRALVLDPEVMLLDEPLGALDPMIRAELQNDLKSIFKSLGKTVVLVTHDMHEAALFADDVILLRDGRVEQHGPYADLVDRPATDFVTAFVRAQRQVHGMEAAP
jgi:osmoprotectant transport system ATP-binding protein